MNEVAAWLDAPSLWVKLSMALAAACVFQVSLMRFVNHRAVAAFAMLSSVSAFAAAYRDVDVRLLLSGTLVCTMVVACWSLTAGQSSGFRLSAILLCLAGFGICVYALHMTAPALAAMSHWMMLTHACSIATLAGLAMVITIDMTLVSSPGQLDVSSANGSPDCCFSLQRQFQLLHMTGLTLVVLEMAVVFHLFAGSTPRSAQTGETLAAEYQLLAWIYAATVLIVCVTLWLVPYRLHLKGSGLRTSEWSTLTMSAWLCMLGLLVILSLPIAWPWLVAGTLGN